MGELPHLSSIWRRIKDKMKQAEWHFFGVIACIFALSLVFQFGIISCSEQQSPVGPSQIQDTARLQVVDDDDGECDDGDECDDNDDDADDDDDGDDDDAQGTGDGQASTTGYYDGSKPDSWGTDYVYDGDGNDSYSLTSRGKDDPSAGGSEFDSDIVYVDGSFDVQP